MGLFKAIGLLQVRCCTWSYLEGTASFKRMLVEDSESIWIDVSTSFLAWTSQEVQTRRRDNRSLFKALNLIQVICTGAVDGVLSCAGLNSKWAVMLPTLQCLSILISNFQIQEFHNQTWRWDHKWLFQALNILLVMRLAAVHGGLPCSCLTSKWAPCCPPFECMHLNPEFQFHIQEETEKERLIEMAPVIEVTEVVCSLIHLH